MALTPQNNDAFAREVDEELRRDQVASIGKRYGLLILGLIVLALVAFGGWQWWQHAQAQAAAKQGEQLSAALDSLGKNQPKAAAAPLAELAGSDVEGYRAMAKFTQADILLQADNLKGAAAKFAEVAQDSALPQPFRDLALIRQTQAEFDTLQPNAVIARLSGLAAPDSPWLGSAGEMVAVSYLALGKRAEAGKLFGTIARTDGVPETIRQRAVQMAGVLGVDAVAQDDPAAQTPARPAAQTEEKNAG
ncbi:tetratricopeptide repeat protein [Sphingomonas japonica]|uniref:Ancillary SecYEG translocon subunit/Cell division coordinator CpoB TPR domain-containing protein n=1 Tax=Sphingomonas japonica TaxID=511662 RepID=A0ABX0TZQ3_9SPHN|nr:tetratricopeptide repeat protein [Sphingomonas japonica]NIJ22834.1 hypothetical protein [Sphingomonas japonica]